MLEESMDGEIHGQTSWISCGIKIQAHNGQPWLT